MADVVISESKLEDMLFNHFSGRKYSDNIAESFEGDMIFKTIRQLNIGNYGIADIVLFREPDYDGSMVIEIYELKKGRIDKAALTQILRYKVGIKKYAEKNGFNIGEIYLFLIGGSISNENHFEFIPQAIENLDIYTYDICPETGITFNCEDGWHFKDLQQTKKLNKLFNCADYASNDQACMYYHYQKKVGV